MPQLPIDQNADATAVAQDSLGEGDTVSTALCLVAGTLIGTPDGKVLVESLQPGDMVLTHDGGPQPLRWIGNRTVLAEGDQAPIRIAADTFGDHRTLMVAPLHRILIRDSLSELLFGEREVLVTAKHLLNDRTVTQKTGGMVTYYHLLFDEHQVVFSEDMPTESMLPGPQLGDGLEQAAQDELVSIFPDFNPVTGTGYSPSARRTLKQYETLVLMSGAMAA